MAEVSLKTRSNRTAEYAPLKVNLTNEESGEVQTYEYQVRRLSKKEGMQIQLEIAEFARDKDGRNLAGFRALGRMIDEIKVPEGAPAFIDLFDLADDDADLEALTNGLVEVATKSTLTD